MSAGQEHLGDLLGRLDETVRELASVREELQRRRVTVRSADRLLSVTVDARGEVQGVTFHTTAYTRLGPDDLGRVVATTVREAQQEMAHGIAERMAPWQGLGASVRESITGGLRRPGGEHP